MSVATEAEPPRPRPLSAGLWTLFSWLRREERASSSESLSSAGSARTAVSFAFLPPTRYGPAAAPLLLPPLAAPTDSYKKRVRERNQRRQHDRDLTLHRKYGLHREGGGYDAFSLPSVRRSLAAPTQERERRATSECLRRAAYVPGKRRAPPPPARSSSVGPATTLPRRHSRKRPAPQPPVPTGKNKENVNFKHKGDSCILIQMSAKSTRTGGALPSSDVSMGCKSEKYSKRDRHAKDDRKSRSERNFLRQIFENKKRNSCIETPPNKILPSISELDRQATEMIENNKSLEHNNNLGIDKPTKLGSHQTGDSSKGNTWFCTRCSKKYDAAISFCLNCSSDSKKQSNKLLIVKNKSESPAFNIYTQTENESTNVASSSRSNDADEQQELKKMLKEMKDSLPKRPRGLNSKESSSKRNLEDATVRNNVDTPTLKIGSPVNSECILPLNQCNIQTSEHKHVDTLCNNKELLLKNVKSATNVAVITQTVVLIGSKAEENIPLENNTKKSLAGNKLIEIDATSNKNLTKSILQTDAHKNNYLSDAKNVHTPLKISSLLNPVYIPKNDNSEMQTQRSLFFSQPITKPDTSRKVTIPAIPSFTSTFSANQQNPTSSSHTGLPVTSPPVSREISSNKGTNANLMQGQKHVFQNESSPNKLSVSVEPRPLSGQWQPKSTCSNATSSTSADATSSDQAKSNKEKWPLDQHSRRRNLINQLEQSIAKGDEDAAAEAAAKLAQLRLACSVLSFSSQIAGEALSTVNNSTSNKLNYNLAKNNENTNVNKVDTPTKVNSATQSSTVLIKGNFKQAKENIEVKNVSARNTVQEVKSTKPAPKIETAIDSEKKAVILQPSVPSTSQPIAEKEGVLSIEVWIEDKKAARGPIRLRIPRRAVVRDLRRQAEESLGVAGHLQRWIVGRTLCADDDTPLTSLAGPNLESPFYLYLVESDTLDSNVKSGGSAKKAEEQVNRTGDVYSELMQLERRALVPNTEPFECGVCMEDCATGQGVVLRECVHAFCRNCLSDVVRHCEEPEVTCPALGCPGFLQEREIRALVSSAEYERWLAHGLAAAESGTRNAFHCRTADCAGWALCEPGVARFPCPVCARTNCVHCQAIHEGETCEQYRTKIQEVVKCADSNQTDEGTRALIDSLISRGEALECPECKAIITKKWGCDWVKCSACKTEICWVTRGRRWGPAGRGDTSGGCRCGVDGKRCHPSCGYCH